MKSEIEINEIRAEIARLLINAQLSPVSKGRLKSVAITLKWIMSDKNTNLIQELDLKHLRGIIE